MRTATTMFSEAKWWEALPQILDWGYMDEAVEHEPKLVLSADNVYAWFEEIIPRHWLLHTVVEPSARGKTLTDEYWAQLYATLQREGVLTLWVHSDLANVNHIMEREGWTWESDSDSWYYILVDRGQYEQSI